MKRTISTLALAAPLAIAALSLGSAPAMAETPGPSSDTISSSDIGPVNPHLPHGPVDKIGPIDPDPEPDPEPDPVPDGPDDKVSIPQPCPAQGDCGDGPDEVPNPTPCGTPEDRGDEPQDEDEPEPTTLSAVPADEDEDEPGDKVIPRPNCIDAGAASSEENLDLTWLMVGSGLITATGAAYAVRRRMRTEA